MASGVFRPYSLPDVLGSLSDGISSLAGSSTSAGTGFFLEADETLGITDSATVTAQANPTWSNGQWGQGVWG
jgi:hypothetical protein